MTNERPDPEHTPADGASEEASGEDSSAQARPLSPGLILSSAFALVILCIGLVILFNPEPGPPPSPSPTPPSPPAAPIKPAHSPEKIQAWLTKAPKPLQLHFVRQLEGHSDEAKRPALTAFLSRKQGLHPGALLESVLQVKRCGEAGARDLVQLYASAPEEQRRVILQAFESSPDPTDAQVLKDLRVSPQDPLAARWANLKRS